ncbi:MAG: NTP transferase domain-containing protein [Vicinamibacterales bacterium]
MSHRERPLLVIPAAGVGSRLRAAVPKALALVGGRPMLDWLIELYQPHVSALALVVSPSHAGWIGDHARRVATLPVDVFQQAQPTGMLDAVLAARPAVEHSLASRIWVTWCDQIAIDPRTLANLADARYAHTALTMPTVWRRKPYIHFDRDAAGRISYVRQRREGDEMPHRGEGDAGVFNFSRAAYLDDLCAYASTLVPGAMTGERNLLPFIPWLAQRAPVATFPCAHEVEAVGINTPADLQHVEAFLRRRERP